MTARMFVKRPVEVEAKRYAGPDDVNRLTNWINNCGGHAYSYVPGADRVIAIRTLEGEMWASPGDWIIKGVRGEFYPCKPDIFRDTYEPHEGDWCEFCSKVIPLDEPKEMDEEGVIVCLPCAQTIKNSS